MFEAILLTASAGAILWFLWDLKRNRSVGEQPNPPNSAEENDSGKYGAQFAIPGVKVRVGDQEVDATATVVFEISHAVWFCQDGLKHYTSGQKEEAYRSWHFTSDILDCVGLRDESAANCGLQFAGTLGQAGELSDASRWYERAREAYIQLQLPVGVARCELGIGSVLDDMGDPVQALTHIQRALEMFSQLGLVGEIADCHRSLGCAFVRSGAATEGLTAFQTAVTAYQELSQERDVIDCQMMSGSALSALGRYREAVEYFELARRRFMDLGLRAQAARCEMGIANAIAHSGDFGTATPRMNAALHTLRAEGTRKDIVSCEYNFGHLLADSGMFEKAIEVFKRTRDEFFSLGMNIEVVECDASIANCFLGLGRPKDAAPLYAKAWATFARLGRENDVAQSSFNLGLALHDLGDLWQALRYLTAAQVVYARIRNKELLAHCIKAIGAVRSDLGEAEQALACYKEAHQLFTELQLKTAIASCEMSMGLAEVDSGHLDQAFTHFEYARAIYNALGYRLENAMCLQNLAWLHLRRAAALQGPAANEYQHLALSHAAEAISTFEMYRHSLTTLVNRNSFAHKYRGAYRSAVSASIALGRLNDALMYSERSHSQNLAESVASTMLLNQNDVDARDYRAYVELRAKLIEGGFSLAAPATVAIPRGLPLEDAANSTEETLRDRWEELVRDIMRRYEDKPFSRRWRLGETNYLRTIDEYKQLLTTDKTCLVEFLPVADDDRLHALLITHQNSLELITFPEGSGKQLGELAARWRGIYDRSRAAIDRAGLVLTTCYQLHQLIFGAIVEVRISNEIDKRRTVFVDYIDSLLDKGHSPSTRSLVLIPNPSISVLPLHASAGTRGTTFRYLIEDYEISYAPSAYLLHTAHHRSPRESPGRALVVGNPLPAAIPLPAARGEAQGVADLLEHLGWTVDLLVENGATRESFLHGDDKVPGLYSSSYGHLHLAQHAELDEDGRPCLVFSRRPESAFYCTEADVAGASLGGMDSVVAATCLSGVTAPALNEYVGLGASFLQAGVRTYVGTYYPLSDLGSSRLVPELYACRFRRGLGWAASLREAQLSMARQNTVQSESKSSEVLVERGPTMSAADLGMLRNRLDEGENALPPWHPYHWCAFAVMGKA